MALIVGLIAAAFALGNLTGGTVVYWKTGAQIAIIKSEKQALESENDILTAENGRCANDVAAVKVGVKEVADALAKKKKDAEDSMKDAQYWAAQHDRLAREVNSAPIRPDETQCEAVEREQREYVGKRHAAK